MNRSLVPAALALACVTWSLHSEADTLMIKRPGAHPRYSFEAEPHLVLALINPMGPARGDGVGVGFRGSINLVDNGFIPKINNSVAIGFGLDWVSYSRERYCVVVGNGNEPDRCYDDDSSSYFWLPVVLQWNFYLSRNWSVFGEPGVAFHLVRDYNDFDPFVMYVGGRYNFSDSVTLTMRLGYPTFSVGVSFLL